MANTVDKVINIALNEVGYLEKQSNSQLYDKTANAGFNNYTKYAHEIDTMYPNFYNGRKNGYAYCDIFVDWCFIKAFGVEKAKELLCQPDKSSGAGCKYSMRYYRNKGQLYNSPVVGDQIFFGSGDNISHTGLVYDVDSVYVYTVEGNTSSASGVIANGGAVEKKKYSLSYGNIAGYGRPKYDVPNQTNQSNQSNNTKPTTTVVSRNYLMNGDKGNEVKAMQEALIKLGYPCGHFGADGDFGKATEVALRAFQKNNGLVVDGKYGEKSKAKADELLAKLAKPTPTISKIDTVKEVQNWANTNYKSGLAVDGIYGFQTKRALVKILQTELNQTYNANLVVDGIWGAKTRAACPTLRMGSKNDVVGALQALLVCNGHKEAYLDNEYGTDTTYAVKSYQKKTGLIVDGLAGKNTFAKLCV